MYSGFLRTMLNLCLRIRFKLAFILHKIIQLFYEKTKYMLENKISEKKGKWKSTHKSRNSQLMLWSK